MSWKYLIPKTENCWTCWTLSWRPSQPCKHWNKFRDSNWHKISPVEKKSFQSVKFLLHARSTNWKLWLTSLSWGKQLVCYYWPWIYIKNTIPNPQTLFFHFLTFIKKFGHILVWYISNVYLPISIFSHSIQSSMLFVIGQTKIFVQRWTCLGILDPWVFLKRSILYQTSKRNKYFPKISAKQSFSPRIVQITPLNFEF